MVEEVRQQRRARNWEARSRVELYAAKFSFGGDDGRLVRSTASDCVCATAGRAHAAGSDEG